MATGSRRRGVDEGRQQDDVGNANVAADLRCPVALYGSGNLAGDEDEA